MMCRVNIQKSNVSLTHICRSYMEFAALFGFAAAEHEAGVGQCHRAALATVWLQELPGSTGCSERV